MNNSFKSSLCALLAAVMAVPASAATYQLNTPVKGLVVLSAPSLGAFSIPAKTYGDAPFALTAPSSNSPGAWSFTSSSVGVATVSGNIVTIVGVGSTTITAKQAASGGYPASTVTATLVVNPLSPTVQSWPSLSKTWGDANFQLTAPASTSPAPWSYASSDANVATVTYNGLVSLVGPGTVTLTANQGASGPYSATNVSTTLTVDKATPTISGFTPLVKVNTDAPFALVNPTSNSSGAWTFTSSNPAVATIAAGTNVVTITGVGTATLTATQAATGYFKSASVTALLTVNNAVLDYDPEFANVTFLANFNTGLNAFKPAVAPNYTYAAISVVSENGNNILTRPDANPYGSISYPVGASASSLSGDFTIEGFVFVKSVGNSIRIVDVGGSVTSGGHGLLEFLPGTGWRLGYNFNSSSIVFGGTQPGAAWTHFAVTRQGSSVRMFVNGAQVGSTVTNGATIGSSNGNISLMNVGSGSSSFIGSVDDIRVTKGVARYTGPFTVPARPFFDH